MPNHPHNSEWSLIVGYDSSDEEWHDASDSDREAEWRGGVESESTTDADDGPKKRLGEEYDSDLSDMSGEYWSEERDDGSGEEDKEAAAMIREGWGAQQARWQIVRQKGQDHLIYGQVHPYPSDEQKPTIKMRSKPRFYTNEDSDRAGLWEYFNGTQDGYIEGFPSEDDYPEEGGWRDKGEYWRQLEWWHDIWGTHRRLLQCSGALRKQKNEDEATYGSGFLVR